MSRESYYYRQIQFKYSTPRSTEGHHSKPQHRSAPQRTAAHRSAPQRTAAHHSAPQRTAAHRSAPQRTAAQRAAARRSAPQRAAAHRSAPQRTAAHRSAPQRTAAHAAHRSAAEHQSATHPRSAEAPQRTSIPGRDCPRTLKLFWQSACGIARNYLVPAWANCERKLNPQMEQQEHKKLPRRVQTKTSLQIKRLGVDMPVEEYLRKSAKRRYCILQLHAQNFSTATC